MDDHGGGSQGGSHFRSNSKRGLSGSNTRRQNRQDGYNNRNLYDDQDSETSMTIGFNTYQDNFDDESMSTGFNLDTTRTAQDRENLDCPFSMWNLYFPKESKFKRYILKFL